MAPLAPSLPDTRHRLLRAAGEIFAEQGFRQARVRDIVERAGVNIAAVNYHFGDKQGLYVAVLQYWLAVSVEKYPAEGALADDAPPEQRLGAFIHAFFFRIMDEGTPAWHGKLLARELADPTPGVIEMLVETHFRGNATLLFKLVRELLGHGSDEQSVRFCAFSVVGQCLFYRHCEHTIRLIAPSQKFGSAQIERIADHITRFALAGIESCRQEAEKPQKSAKARRIQRERP